LVVKIQRRVFVGAALGLFLAAGCSGEPDKVEFKETETTQFKDMQDQMIKGMVKKDYRKSGGRTGTVAPKAP